jgi:glycosyltransferase involved in cell wall biosynthesis
MKLICFIDSLGSGGAQRQLTLLSVLLKARGHEMLFVTYNAGKHFEPELSAKGIPRLKLDSCPKWMRPIALRRVLNKFQPDGVIAFQEAPSLYAEIASFGLKRWRLIVSERSAVPFSEISLLFRYLKYFHRFADIVTTNSNANRLQLEQAFPFLCPRLVTIYNAVDLNRFRPVKGPESRDELRFVVLASHKPARNFEGLALAVRILSDDETTPAFSIDWFGDEAPGWLARDQACCERVGVGSVIHLHPATNAPEDVLDAADALIMPSLWEGLPNSVCEALSVGCPVLMSDVADARFLVQEGLTGYLFDPRSPESTADAMRKFLFLSSDQRQASRVEARRFAERVFDPTRYVSAYEALLDGQVPQDGGRCPLPESQNHLVSPGNA